MTYYFNIRANDNFRFAGDGCVAAHDMSLPVEVLFNENDTCGEVMPLADMAMTYKTQSGETREYQFAKGENIILSHEDISENPIV